uniref:Methyltransferase small domain-containing protein n=1 Tax=Chloropicon primus TaxID=1764295 RepID=A0A7S2WYL8_9CHLO|mmetsp:Transcript_1919/g.5227  ORF Transcript_1919/g.5227 Transcript_1919/m.5227 type:complete len:281 (+) Transcript_1919:276-1118(+)
MASMRLTSYPDGVYPPSDDTFLLVDALEQDVVASKRNEGGPRTEGKKSKLVAEAAPLDASEVGSVVEIGSGSGFVITSAAVLLPTAYAVGTDLSSRACLASRETLRSHPPSCSSRSDVVATESLRGFRPGAAFDVVLVNPPYVPTSSEELAESLRVLRGRREASEAETEGAAFTLTWAGGVEGVEMTKEMLRAGLGLLNARGGRLYLIVVQENRPEEMAKHATRVWRELWGRSEGDDPAPGLSWSIAIQTRANNELLSVLRFIAGGDHRHSLPSLELEQP